MWANEFKVGYKLNIENGYILSMRNEYINVKNRDLQDLIIINLDGKTIAESTDEYKIYYATASEYYIKSKEKEYVQVYDMENNKISEISLKENNDAYYELTHILPNGMYITYKYEVIEGQAEVTYKLYNIKSELIKESRGIHENSYANNSKASYVSVHGEDDILFKNDGKGILFTGRDISFGFGLTGLNIEELKERKYAILEKGYPKSDIIINLDNEKTIGKPKGYDSDYFCQSPNGKYMILYSDVSFGSCVYDEKFNKLYETSNSIRAIDDEYVLEEDTTAGQIFILNIFTGEKMK